MEPSSIFGLPAHPLLVHVPIVLIPLVTIGALAMLHRKGRDRFGWLIVALAGVSAVGVQLAMGSGEALEHDVPKSATLSRHIELADAVRPLVVLLFAAVAAVMLLHRRTSQRADQPQPRWIVPTVAVVAVLIGVATNVQLARVGHNGAKAVWHDQQTGQETNAAPSP